LSSFRLREITLYQVKRIHLLYAMIHSQVASNIGTAAKCGTILDQN